MLRVIAGAEFKLKYAGSALGYVWSVVKPLALFTMLYVVFGHVFKLGSISHYYPLSLLIGIVLFNFFSDATSIGMSSLVTRESLLRKLSFPRLDHPDRRHAHRRDHASASTPSSSPSSSRGTGSRPSRTGS